MSSNLKVLEQRNVLGKEFKVYGTTDSPLFLARDVANWIEHNKPAEMLQHVDKNEKLIAIVSLSGQNRECWFLTEDGLYEVLMQSRKPIAKEFKKQVKQILKDIRKHGVYATDEVLENILTNPDFGIKVLTELKVEREKRTLLEKKVKEDEHKVVFAEAVKTARNSILIGELAKILKQNGRDIGQNRLFEWLRQNDYLMKQGTSRNMPTQKSMEIGLFEIKESVITNQDGSIRVTKTTKVTGKGQIYFINLLTAQQVAI